MPYGTSLEDKDAFLTPIEEYCLTLPEVEHVAFSARLFLFTADVVGFQYDFCHTEGN